MSTANNRLEIVGLGKKSVTFRFIQTDRAHDPVGQNGSNGIDGRKSTRSEERDFSKLEHFVVVLNDPDSTGTEITRVIRAKINNERDGKEKSAVQKGEFAPGDHNVWTDLSHQGTPSEANALTSTSASPATINNYPNIIATKYGGYNPQGNTDTDNNYIALVTGQGSELFGNGQADANSPLVRFLSGQGSIEGFHQGQVVKPYVLKQKGDPEGTIMFRIVSGEGRDEGDEGVILNNKHYHIVSIEAHFLNEVEVFSNDTTLLDDGAAPIESAIETDHKFAVERRIAQAMTDRDNVTIDDRVTLYSEVRTACGINDKTSFAALDLYDRPDLSESIMFLTLDNVALTEPAKGIATPGKKRKKTDSSPSAYEENQTEISLDISGLPEEVAILNSVGKNTALKTFLKLELEAQLLSRNGTKVIMEPLPDPSNEEDREINKFYLTADSKIVITPSLALRQTGDLDIKLSVNIEQDRTSFTTAAAGRHLRKTLAGVPYLLENNRAQGEGAVVLAKMSGYQALKTSGGTDPTLIVEQILKHAAANAGSAASEGLDKTLYADVSLTNECIFGAATADSALGRAAMVALGAASEGLGNTLPAGNVAKTSQAWSSANVTALEITKFSPTSRKESGIRQRRITRSGGLKAENIEANWRHSAPKIKLTDRGETTQLKSGSTTDYEAVPNTGAYRRARSSDGFYISVENATTGAYVEKASHCLVLYKEQSRSEYEDMFDKDGKLNKKADALLASTKWKTVHLSNNDRALAATTNDSTWYVEKALPVSKEDHGKCFTILACWGRTHESKTNVIVWGDLGELGRITDEQKSPNSDAGEYFTGDIGPQLYINEKTLGEGFSVKLSNRVTGANNIFNQGYFHVKGDMDKAFSNFGTALVKDAVDKLIGLTTTKRPVAAETAKGIDKFDAEIHDPIGVYTNAVRDYARECGLSTAVVDLTQYVDPTKNKGTTTVASAVSDMQADLTMFQKKAKAAQGGLTKTDFARIQNFAYVAVNGLTAELDKGDFDTTTALMDADSGVYVMGMLYRLRKLKQIIANNPIAKNAAGDVIVKPTLNLAVDGIQNQIAKRFASGQQVGDLRMILEVTDGVLNTPQGGSTYSADAYNAKSLKDLTAAIYSSATMDISEHVRSDISDGDKYMQLTAARIALDGRGKGLNSSSAAGGDWETVAKGSKKGSSKLGAAADVATAAASIFFDDDHKVTRDDDSGGKRVCRPSLKKPFLRTTVLQNASTHMYGTMRATEYERPGVTLSTGSGRNDAVLEIGLNLLNVTAGKLAAGAGAYSSTPTENEKMAYVMSHDRFDIHERFSTTLVASFDQHKGPAFVTEFPIKNQKLVAREYDDSAVVTDTGRETQNTVKKSGNAKAAGYQLIGLISANFDNAYQQDGNSTDLNARLRIGMQQTIMGPIKLDKEPVYGVPSPGQDTLDFLPVSIEIDATMISRATDSADKEMAMRVTTNSGVQSVDGNVDGAEFGAVGYMGEYEVNNRERNFGPWFLKQAELGDISVTQGAPGTDDHGKVLIAVEESIANRSIKKPNAFADTNPMDVDDDDMFEVMVRARSFADPGELSSNGWGGWQAMEKPTHAGSGVADEDVTTVYTLADLEFKTGGSSIGTGQTAVLLVANKRLEIQFQQFAKVASEVKTIAKEGGSTAADDSAKFSSTDIAIGNAKTISVVYTRMKDLISADEWVVDKIRETNPDMLNTITASNGTDKGDFIRIEPNDLVSLASNPFEKPDDTLIVNKSDGNALAVEDHEISAWADPTRAGAYSNFNVKLVVEASIVSGRSLAGAVQKEKLVTLGEVEDLQLVPKVARAVQAMPAINNFVQRNATASLTVGSANLLRPIEYNNPVSNISSQRIADSWLLVNKNDGTLWRQAMFEGLFAKMEAALAGDEDATETEITIMSTRLRVQLVGSGPSYSGSDDIRMLINTQVADNILVADAKMPKLQNNVDPLQGFNQLLAPTIIDSDYGAAKSNKRLEIPITLSVDGLEQVNIMIAHSTDVDAYFNDLRADGDNVRNFKKRVPASGSGNTFVAAKIANSAADGGASADGNIDSIQLAATPAAVSAANGGTGTTVKRRDLITDAISDGSSTSADKAAKNLFFFQKINSDGQRETANVDFQVEGGTSASNYPKDLSGKYILHAAIPAEGDNQFLLLNVVTTGGNRKFVAYKKSVDEDGNQTFERVNKHHHD